MVPPTWKSGSEPPQGPCHIKSTTAILIHYCVGKKYDGSESLQQGLWNTLFPGENSQEISTDSELLRR